MLKIGQSVVKSEKKHKEYGYKVLSASTKQERLDIAKEYELGYMNSHTIIVFDLSLLTLCIIYLGSAKHIMNTWKSLGWLLDKTQFSVVQSRIKLCNVPSDVGRIPIKVEACIGSLTADECKTGLVFTRLYRMLVEVCTSMLNHLSANIACMLHSIT